MAEVLYPDGYGKNKPYLRMATIDQVFARSSVKMLHAEYQKRWRGLMIASGGRLGIGGAGRSTAQQERVFLQRHVKVKSGGCCIYKNQRYQLKHGFAHAAAPGKSFHEQIVQGKCAAVDAIGDLKWAAKHCERFGLEQAVWGNEVWHFQFTEFPHSVSQWKSQGSPAPQNWVIPGGTTPPTPPKPKPPQPPPSDWVTTGAAALTPPGNPTLKKGVVHSNVTWLQAVLCSMPTLPADGGKPIYNPDWVDKDRVGAGAPTSQLYGDATYNAVKYWQSKNKRTDGKPLTVDGVYGPETAAAMTAVRGK